MAQPQPSTVATLGIIAGGGRLPLQLAETCEANKRPFFVLAFEDSADIASIQHLPHAVVRLGAVGEALDHLRNANVSEVVMAGKVKRPSFSSLKPDRMGTKLLARMGGAFFSGDDALLKAIVGFFEEEGFSVVGSDTIMGGLLTPSGLLGTIHPDSQARGDIAYGMKVIQVMGSLDIGQAVIIENGYVLGVEAAEGTDMLIERCAGLRKDPKGGVLVKARKPYQETRVDLPAIGPDTIVKLHAAGFSGIGLEAAGTLILDKARVIENANRLGIFIIGVTNE